MAKKKIRLTSQCNVKGSEGNPGDIVDMDEKLAAQVIAGKGGVEVGADGNPVPKEKADEA